MHSSAATVAAGHSRRTRFVALATIILLLVGCMPAQPVVTPVPVPSHIPLFASDADALFAATAAYAAYLAMSAQITRGGGANTERPLDVAVSESGETKMAGFAGFSIVEIGVMWRRFVIDVCRI